MENFECKSCGKCCTRESLGDAPGKYPRFTCSFLFYCRSPRLALFDWEAEKLEKKGAKVVPLTVLYDLKTSTAIVLQYTIEGDDCSFLQESKCSEYTDRPLCCRYYPVTTGMVADFKNSTISFSPSKCPEDSYDWAMLKEIDKRKLLLMLRERYGESYLAFLEYEVAIKTVMKWAGSLVARNLVKPAKEGYDEKTLLKRINQSKLVPISKLVKEKLEVDTEEFIREAKALAHGKAMLLMLEGGF